MTNFEIFRCLMFEIFKLEELTDLLNWKFFEFEIYEIFR